MSKRDSYLLRISPEVLDSLRGWADDEFRSLNGQIEFILSKALEQAGRSPKGPKAVSTLAVPTQSNVRSISDPEKPQITTSSGTEPK